MMSISVRIPTPLRQYTNGQSTVSVEGSTVNEAIQSLVTSYPNIKSKLLEESGAVRRYVRLFANSRDIREQQDMETAVREGDEISIVPAIAGGAH
jgi:molybdopterin synthase sulfur carrier subunit